MHGFSDSKRPATERQYNDLYNQGKLRLLNNYGSKCLTEVGREDKIDKIKDENGIWRVRSRINKYQSVLLPKQDRFTERLIEYDHLKTLHGGVQATMCKIRETI